MGWPPQSADLNFTESAWEFMRKQMILRESPEKLWKVYKDAWNNLPETLCTMKIRAILKVKHFFTSSLKYCICKRHVYLLQFAGVILSTLTDWQGGINR